MKTTQVDSHLEDAISWFHQFIPHEEWESRRTGVLSYLDTTICNPDGKSRPVSFNEDVFAWYMVLAELFLSRSPLYDFFQGCRVIPYFVAIGMNTTLVSKIGGVEERVRRVVQKNGDHPDTGIFEILTALCYQRNSYSDVQFIKEGESKSPDLYAFKEHGLFIECKRMAKVSGYSLQEREKWMKLWSPVGQYLQQNRISLFFKIRFNEELCALRDDYLEAELIPKIKFLPTTFGARVLESEEVTIDSSPIDYSRIYSRLAHNRIPSNSANLISTVLGEYEQFGNYRLVLDFQPDAEWPSLVDEIRFAAGVSWSSRSDEALMAKSRHIKRHLAKALKQLPKDERGSIHFGIEAIEGDEVEQLRLLKSNDEIRKFDFGDKSLQWLYYHILSPMTNPVEDWAFEETATSFKYFLASMPKLPSDSLIPFDELKDGFAWDYR